MKTDFERHMVETRVVGVVCGYCDDEMEIDVSSSSFDTGVSQLNATLNEHGWVLEHDVVTCPDCLKIPPRERGAIEDDDLQYPVWDDENEK
jgi:hypothetical protein